MGFSRFEWEKEIDVADAKQLIQMCPNPIEKTRWLVPAEVEKISNDSASAVWEVDEFHGRLKGLVIAELELENEQQTFCKPTFVGEEVTGDPRYYNANM
jgi:CYTH domain-containing protein